MKKINLATWFTILRLVLLPFLLMVLLYDFGYSNITIDGIFINVKYLVAGVIFVIGSLTDFIDGYIARKYNMITDLGKFLDPIADKLLVNSTIIVLAAQGMISPLIVVILIGRDTIVDVIRMIVSAKGEVIAASKYGKLKTVFQMVGITSVLFFNLPFALYDIPMASILMYIATFFSLVSMFDYYSLNKHYIFDKE